MRFPITYSLLIVFSIAPLTNLKASEATILFRDHSLLNLDITSNFTKIFADRKFEFPELRTYQEAHISHHINGVQKNIVVNMRARGWERLNSCQFPPLKIDFKKDEDNKRGTIFEGSKALKHVTRCDDKNKSRWVLREYFIYKMYEKMTPISLKVRATWTTYRNNAEKGKIISSQPGFLLENTAQMAKRNGLTKVEVPEKTGMDWRSVDRQLYLKLQLFQYMIYNSDYGIFANDMRNIEIVKGNNGKLYPVAYDFDSTEFVRSANIGHAPFQENSNFCYQWNEVEAIWPSFKTLQQPFLQIISSASDSWLNRREKMNLTTSLNNFFEMYENGELKKVVERTWVKQKCHLINRKVLE